MARISNIEEIDIIQNCGYCCTAASVAWILDWFQKTIEIDLNLRNKHYIDLQKKVEHREINDDFKSVRDYCEKISVPKGFLKHHSFNKGEGDSKLMRIREILNIDRYPCLISLPSTIFLTVNNKIISYWNVKSKQINDDLIEWTQDILRRIEEEKKDIATKGREGITHKGYAKITYDLVSDEIPYKIKLNTHITPIIECDEEYFSILDLDLNSKHRERKYPLDYVKFLLDKTDFTGAKDIMWINQIIVNGLRK